jgi:3-oxoacyl-[acyl-carrier protein] reductase
MLLEGKVVIVTGGGRGIGGAISGVLAREGAAVAVNYSASREKAEQLARQIEGTGGRALAVGADVRDPDAVQAMVAQVIATFGRVDGVVNNAISGRQMGKLEAISGRQMGKLEEASMEDFETAFGFGARAVVNTITAVRPHMRQAGGGRIVNIVTELWNMAPAGWSVYMAGKGAMVGISRSLALELGPENITVNMVAPGWMADDKVEPGSPGTQSYAQTVPLRRQGDAEEIGKVCAFFLSDLAAFVTGAYVPVCGGRVTQMGN